MQRLTTFTMLTAAAGLLLASSATVRAQTSPLEKVSITATLYVQGVTTDNGTTTTIKAPTRVVMTTASLLKQLAVDEIAESMYTPPGSASTFPAGAKLDWNGTGFEVDLGTNELVDVSDILSVSASGQNNITAGSSPDSGLPPFSQTSYQLYTLTYDDSSSTGALTFTVTGLVTAISKGATANARTGNYIQSGTFSLQDGTGEGQNAAGEFVITGFTATGSGSAVENDGAGTD